MKLAFMFPGQGAQKIGMGKELHENFPAARQVFEEASDALSLNIARLCFEGPESELVRTENTQPAVLTASVAALRVLESESGARPAVVAGHSLGEYTALVAAGALDLPDAARIVRLRGRFMQEAVPEGEGAMAAVIGLEAKQVEALCEEVADSTGLVITPGNYNSPEQTAISGHKKAVERASELAAQRGAKRVVQLRVSAPFHSPLMQPAADKLALELKKLNFNDASPPVIANVDSSPHTRAADFPGLLTDQATRPVRWSECVERFDEFEVELALEIGSGKTLIGLMRSINPAKKSSNVEDLASLKKTLSLIG